MLIDSVDLRAPARTPETDPFWDAANEERLLFALCHDCGKPHYYPRKVCPFCFSIKIGFTDASGQATIHAFSLFRRGQPPYVSAWVILEEGVAVLSNITQCDTDMLEIGTPVQVVFHPANDGQLVPVFRPCKY
jgi:uncharacterized OB-fold protein